ncbi:MAG: Protein of uncharacterized function [Mycobacterium sp.]|nr:Protein of uncharacterized function [Mycobacterium sp.]
MAVACPVVPRSFVVSAESPGTVEQAHRAFGSESYWQARLAAFDTGSPTLDSLTTDADGTTTATMTLSFGGDQLPPPLNRLHAGVLHVLHRERWYAPEDGHARGEITVDARGLPLSGGGALSLTPVPDGLRFECTATVTVNVPLIGGTIAKLIAEPLADGILDIHVFTNQWVAENL